ncbi:MAG TPA: FUN14 domain-containing protein [Bacteroidia bacterium]|nr:FUN14 domain-containing protein [Bacteroidia bacterium]
MIPTTESLISSAGFPLVGGGAIGFGVGYLLKNLIKLAFIALGLIALLLGYLEYQKWISVNWVTVENQTSVLMTHAANKIATITQHMNHEIPIGMGLLGFAPGVAIGFYKG